MALIWIVEIHAPGFDWQPLHATYSSREYARQVARTFRAGGFQTRLRVAPKFQSGGEGETTTGVRSVTKAPPDRRDQRES